MGQARFRFCLVALAAASLVLTAACGDDSEGSGPGGEDASLPDGAGDTGPSIDVGEGETDGGVDDVPGLGDVPVVDQGTTGADGDAASGDTPLGDLGQPDDGGQLPDDSANVADDGGPPDTLGPVDASPLDTPDAQDVGGPDDGADGGGATDVGGPADVGSPADTILPPGDAGDGGPADVAAVNPSKVGCSDGTREGFLDQEVYPKIAACGGAWTIPGIHNTQAACNDESGNTGVNPMGEGCNVTDLCAENWHVCYGKVDVLTRNPLGCGGCMDGAPSPAFFLARTSSVGAFNCSQDSTLFGGPGTSNDLFGCGNLGCPTTQGDCASGSGKCDPGEPCATCAEGFCADGSVCDPGVCYPLDRGSHDLCKALRNKPTSSCACYFAGELDPADPKYQAGDMTTVVCQPTSGGCGWCLPLDYWAKKLGAPQADLWDCGTNTTEEANNVVKTDPYSQGGVLCCSDDDFTP